MEFEGKIYGVALQPSVSILVWNKDILTASGLDTEKAPESWDELLANMEKVYAGGEYSGGGLYAGSNNGGYLRFGAMLQATDGWFSDENGNPYINNPANITAFEFLRKMSSYNKPGIISAADEGTFFSAFDKGQLAYKVDGVWAICQSQQLGLNCGYSVLPNEPSGHAGNVVIGAGYQAVPTYSQSKEEAFGIIELMISKEFQQNIGSGGIRIPALKEVSSSDEYKTEFPDLASLAGALDEYVAGLPTFAGDASKAWAAVGNAMSKTMSSGEDIKAILDEAQKEMEDAVSG
jgi:multiple sugar transport system substrate-binding protein